MLLLLSYQATKTNPLAHSPSQACNVLLADEMQRRSGRGASGLVSCSADPGPTASMLLRNALPQVST